MADAVQVTGVELDAKNAGSNGQNGDTAGTGKGTGNERGGKTF